MDRPGAGSRSTAAFLASVWLAGCGKRAVVAPAGASAYTVNDARGETSVAVDADAKRAFVLKDGTWAPVAEPAVPRPAARKAAAPPAPEPGATPAATAASPEDRQRAQVALLQARSQLGRLNTSGFQALVADDLAGIGESLGAADAKLAAGDAADAETLAADADRSLAAAKKKIESETHQPLRW